VIQEVPKVTLGVRPTAVRVRPLHFAEDGVARTALAVSFTTTAYVADAPPPEPAPLPDLAAVTGDERDGRFHFVLPAAVPVSTLAQPMRERLVNAPSALPGGITFRTTRVDVRLSGDRAHLRIDFNASKEIPPLAATGTLHAVGTLTYDLRNQALRVDDITYDAATRTALLRDADWLLDPAVLQDLEKSAVFPLEAEVIRATETVRVQVAKLATPAGAYLALDLPPAEIKLREVQPAGDLVYLFFDMTGKSQARLTRPAATATRGQEQPGGGEQAR
jgi:Domain of unknown function (DUF4403)